MDSEARPRRIISQFPAHAEYEHELMLAGRRMASKLAIISSVASRGVWLLISVVHIAILRPLVELHHAPTWRSLSLGGAVLESVPGRGPEHRLGRCCQFLATELGEPVVEHGPRSTE